MSARFTRSTVIAIFGTIFSLFALPAIGQAEDVPLQTAQAIAEHVQETHDLIGIAVSIYPAYGTADKGAAGLRVKGGDAKVTPDDKWHLGSCTKAMTAMLVADFVQQGKLSLDTTMPDLFPDFANTMDPAWQEVTLASLLTHRSGIKDLGPAWLIARRFDQSPLAQQRYQTAQQILSAPPGGDPGTFQYSNFGYILAGAALETRSQTGWEALIQQGIPGHLMGETGWGFGPPQGDQPEGHVLVPFLGLRAAGQKTNEADNPAALAPAGGVHATHDAWARFARGMIADNSPLSKALRSDLLTPPKDADYALGWSIIEDDTYGTLYQHAGSNTMWLSQIIIQANTGAVILVTTNQFGDAADAGVREATTKALASANRQ